MTKKSHVEGGTPAGGAWPRGRRNVAAGEQSCGGKSQPTAAQLANAGNAANSSLIMVAGASFVTQARPELEQTHVIDYRELRARGA